MKSLMKRFFLLHLFVLFSSGILIQVSGPSAYADSILSSTLDGNFHSPVFGPSEEFFYTSQAFEETVNNAGVWRSNFLKIRSSDLGIVSSTRVEFAIDELTINSSGTHAFGIGRSKNSIAKINLTTMVVTEIPVTSLGSLSGFEIDSAGAYGYVSGNKYDRTVNEREIYNNFVIKINLSTGESAGTLGGNENNWNPTFYGIALHEAQNFGCVVDNEQGVLQSFRISPFGWYHDTGCASVTGSNPFHIEFDNSKTFGYVSVAAEKKLMKFNLSSGEVIKTLTFPSYTSKFRLNPSSTFAYLVDEEANPSYLYKISLSVFEIVERIPFTTSNRDFAISPNGSVGIVLVANGLVKISLSASAPQSITFTAPTSQLTGSQTISISAVASSLLPVSYNSTTPSVCTVSGALVSLLNQGNCTLVAAQEGSSLWDPAVAVERTFKVFLSPPSSNTGISISAGKSFSNTKNVELEINWPQFADAVRLSNDGGFGSAATITKILSPTTSWVLDDSVKGVYTKVVYARFTGEGIDTTKTFSDDIILDTTAPVLSSASASSGAGSIKLKLSATDDITGMDRAEIRSGSQLITLKYDANLTLDGKDLGISTASASVGKLSLPKVEVRVSDNAGNWSASKTLDISGIGSVPDISSSKSFSANSIATFAKLKVQSGSKVSLRVAHSSVKFCKVTGTSLKGLKPGSCKVTVTVRPKKGKTTSKTITLRVVK